MKASLHDTGCSKKLLYLIWLFTDFLLAFSIERAKWIAICFDVANRSYYGANMCTKSHLNNMWYWMVML